MPPASFAPTPSPARRRLALLGVGLLLAACQQQSAAARPQARAADVKVAAPPPAAGRPRAVPASPGPPVAADSRAPVELPSAREYPWLEGVDGLHALDARISPPPGFTRVALEPESFGAFLRGLPLAPEGSPVRDHRGAVRYPASDRRILAVSALDISAADLQQCADTVLRLHAEWRWARGYRDHSYRAAAGTELPLARFLAGERVAAQGARLKWQRGRPRALDHAALRDYLDMVFAWANTGSLARDAAPVPPGELRPGDFFVLPGNPGHTVLVLDLARAPGGELRALIGQSYMPAQSFYVLRGPDAGWFPLAPPLPVDTPFWVPFPWSALRRLS